MSDEKLFFLSLKFNRQAFAALARLLRPSFERSRLTPISLFLQNFLRLSFSPELRGVPSLEFELALEEVRGRRPPSVTDMFVFALQPLGSRQADELQAQVAAAQREGRAEEAHVSIDLPNAVTDVWCPHQASFPLFGQRDLALTQIHAEAAIDRGALGNGVNVVIVDQGLNREVLQARFPGVRFRGGWIVDENGRGGPPGPVQLVNPGEWPDGHGTRMAEMVLSVAPQVNIIDLPLLPSRIVGLQDWPGEQGFMSWAAGIYWLLHTLIPWLRQFPTYQGPWVLCNAWAVYDLREDLPLPDPRNYGQNPANSLNLAVTLLPLFGRADIVFAAGNCGQYCPDPRCAAGQKGPGRSIYGVAAIGNVLSVGAVRGDRIWLGYSSQGPSPPPFASAKPDLCAPSQFAGPPEWGWGRAYTGTSTACALTTGAVAAARSFPATRGLPPAALHARAVATTSVPLNEAVPNQRVGAGLLDIDALL